MLDAAETTAPKRLRTIKGGARAAAPWLQTANQFPAGQPLTQEFEALIDMLAREAAQQHHKTSTTPSE